ncbi:MAG: AMP phosphorylase [Candidatus Woesearchaeota archaeon]
MKFKIKDMDIATGGPLVALVNWKDARELDLHHGDRLIIKRNSHKTIAVVDIAESEKTVPQGHLGLFEEVLDKLRGKNNDVVVINLSPKPTSIQYIKEKLEGKELTSKQIHDIVEDIVNDRLAEIELTYFVAACYTYRMTIREISALTKEIYKHGDTLKIKRKIIVDKHSSGGVPGNRTTMIVVPIVAAAGLTMPKTSSRSITSPAGTADTMEVLAKVSFSVKKMKSVVEKTGACICWGGAINLAAADDKLIKIRHPISLDPEGMLLASILAKKAAVGATHVIIDIPVGKDTKIKTEKRARHLAAMFIKLGNALGMKIRVMITDGSQPIGNGIGPALEARDVLKVLMNKKDAPQDLRNKALQISTEIFKMTNQKNPAKLAVDLLESGKAFKKMQEIIRAQGGNPNIKPEKIKIGKFVEEIKAEKSGKVKDINNFIIARIARIAGAPADKRAGIFIAVKENDSVKKGQLLFKIYSNSKEKLEFAKHVLKENKPILLS